MAELRATPMSNPIMGLLADRLKKAQQFGAKPFGYENPPVEMLMNLLGVPAVQQTMERMAYGEPLTTGRGMTTKPRAEAIEAAMAVAPVAGLLGKATKGLPVGASIENVGKDLSAINIGDRTIPVTINRIDKKSGGQLVNVNPSAFDEAFSKTGWQYVGEKGKDGISGRYEKFENYLKDAKSIEASNVSVNKDGGIVFGDGRHRYAVLRDMGLDELPIVMDKESIKNAKKFGYLSDSPANPIAPRQEALDKAQRNAALPVEEGGLGLPKDNTPEMRAMAMGFDVDAYHGTNTPDILAFDPTLMGKQSGGNLKASFFADRPSAANYYINETPENVVIKPQYAEEYNKIYSKFTNDEAKAIEKFNETYGKNIRSTVQIPWDEANPEVLALKNQARKSADEYFGKYFDEDIVQNPKYFDKNPEGLVYPVKLNTKGLLDYDAGGATWTPYQDQRIKSILSQEGLTLDDVGGVNIANSYDADVGQKIGVYGIADPSRIRSRFAAFDPMRRNEPDILAGVLPLGLLADEEQRKKLYELVPSLLGQ